MPIKMVSMKHSFTMTMRTIIITMAVVLFITVCPGSAQDKPQKDNIINGELYPHGYTPMEIKNGVYPRD